MRPFLRKGGNRSGSLKQGLARVLLAGILLSGCAVPEQDDADKGKPFTGPAAVWQGAPQALAQAARTRCQDREGSALKGCLGSVLAELGASPQAIRFSRRLQESGVLLAYRDAGPVAVARVFYPFQEGAPEGILLIHGHPLVVDVDDRRLWPLEALEERTGYRKLRSSRPDLRVRPGNRSAPGSLAVQQQPEGGWRFITGYVLESRGEQGDIAGVVDFAFDYDDEGRFLGTAVIEMGKTLHAVPGETVTLTVEGTAEGDSGWRAVRVPPGDRLRLVSKALDPGGPGDPQKETWTFQALAPGRVPVILQHLSDPEGRAWPDQRASYLVVIHAGREERDALLEEPFRKAIERRLRDIHSPMAEKVILEIVGVEGGTARVDIFPRNAERLIGAAVYLKQQQGVWRVLSIGTEFEPAFYRKHDIPWILQVLEEPKDVFKPLPAEMATGVQEAVAEALGTPAELEPGVAFRDPVSGRRGTGSRITLRGTGLQFEGLESIAQGVSKALKDLGWEEDLAYAADGPLGTATGFRKGAGRVVVRVVREPAEKVGLLSTQPPSLCELLPEEWVYTITLDCAQRR